MWRNRTLPGWYLLLAAAALVLFVPFLGCVHLFDWDEVNFAECAREMLATHDFSILRVNYLPFWEKPPLFIWMQAACMAWLGVGDLAARLPNALCGVATLLALFHHGTRWRNRRFGLLWVLAYAGSFLPHFYFKTGIIDPWFNLFIFLSFAGYVRFTDPEAGGFLDPPATRQLLLSALFLSLAVLTKGPVAFLIFGLCLAVDHALSGLRRAAAWRQLVLYAGTVCCLGGLWFGVEALAGQAGMVRQFLAYQIRLLLTPDAGHGGPFYFHALALLLGCFPASLLAIPGFAHRPLDSLSEFQVRRWMHILFFVVLILFSLVKTKIVHYSSLCYFPLTYLAADVVTRLWDGELAWPRWMTACLAALGGALALVLAALGRLPDLAGWVLSKGWIKDPFAAACLGGARAWGGWEWVLGAGLGLGLAAALACVHARKLRAGLLTLFGACLVAVNLALPLFTPGIEACVQGPAVNFYESLRGQACYVQPYGFKSFAHLYYARTPGTTPDAETLFKTAPDRRQYFVAKLGGDADHLAGRPDLRRMYSSGGFVFFERRRLDP